MNYKSRHKYKRKLYVAICSFLLLIIVINALIAIQVYSITHFGTERGIIHPDSIAATTSEKAKALILGADIPKPITKSYPRIPYERLNIPYEEQGYINALRGYSILIPFRREQLSCFTVSWTKSLLCYLPATIYLIWGMMLCWLTL